MKVNTSQLRHWESHHHNNCGRHHRWNQCVYTHPSIYKVNEYLGRMDYQVGADNHLFLRGDGFTQNTSFVGQLNEPSQSYYSTVTTAGYVFDWDRNINDHVINDVHAGFHYFQFGNFPFFSDNSIVLTLPQVTVGEPYNEPEVFDQYTQQYRDDLFWLKGKHSIKLGGEYLYTLHGGSFPQYLRGGLTTCTPGAGATPNYAAMFPNGTLNPSTWNFAAINNYCSCGARSYTQAFGNYNIDIARNIIGVWTEDDWKIVPRLTSQSRAPLRQRLGRIQHFLTSDSRPHHSQLESQPELWAASRVLLRSCLEMARRRSTAAAASITPIRWPTPSSMNNSTAAQRERCKLRSAVQTSRCPLPSPDRTRALTRRTTSVRRSLCSAAPRRRTRFKHPWA